MKKELLAMLERVSDSFRKNYCYTRALNSDPIEKTQVLSYKSQSFVPVHERDERAVDVWIVEIMFNGVSIAKVCKVMETYNEFGEVVPVADDTAETIALKEMTEKVMLSGISTIFKSSHLRQMLAPSMN